MPTPLIYTANRDNPWNWAARASQLQFSAHRSEGRVPGLAYIVSEARAQACTQAQACWHSFHTSRRSALASEHFSEGKFEAYHKAQQTQLFFHATKPVHCGTPASTVSQSLHRHGTWMLHLQSKALSKGSCVISLHMLTHLLVDSSSKQKSDTGSDRVGCATSRSFLLQPTGMVILTATGTRGDLHVFNHVSEGHKVIYWISLSTQSSFILHSRLS